jgi:EmrB/QacA subfamily drug resistance transporter
MIGGVTSEPVRGFSRSLALLVAGAYFMEFLDATVIAPAAPHIAADLGVPAVAVNLTITAYVLTLAVLIPVSGWLTERFGTRRVFLTAVAVFTLASAGCALAADLPMLVATRVLQGAGGAMMVPVGRLVVIRSSAKTELVRAIAYLTWPALVAPLLAPAIGGVLSTYASWRLIFVVNLPLGLVALALARRLVPDVRVGAAGRLDWPGFALVATGIAALVVGMEEIGAADPRWPVAIGSLVLAGVLLTGTIRHLLRAARPLLDLGVLRIRTFRATAYGGSVYRAVITAIPFLLPLFFQLGFGWTAARAGVVVIALFAGNVGIKPATTPLMRRFGIRTVMLASVVASAACLVAMAFLRPATPLPVLLGVLLLSGIFRSVGFTAYNTVAFADVPAERMTGANTLLSTVQELGSGLGVALGAMLVRLGGPVGSGLGIGSGLGAGSGSGTAFRVAFVVLAIVLVVPAIDAALLPQAAGNVVTGRA